MRLKDGQPVVEGLGRHQDKDCAFYPVDNGKPLRIPKKANDSI